MTDSTGPKETVDSFEEPLDMQDRIGYDPMTDTYHARHSWEEADPIWLTVIRGVGAVAGQEPTAMDSLYSVLDPEALESLMASTREHSVQVRFVYEGCTVTVAGSGDISIQSTSE